MTGIERLRAMAERHNFLEPEEARKMWDIADQIEREWDELRAEVAEMRPRLMPEGMEWLVESWPRFEDDAPVRFLDDFERYGEENGVSAVTMYLDGSFALNFRAYSKGEHVNRPAPKVLDADGEEIRVGDEVWWICEGDDRGIHAERLRVETLGPNGLIECSPYNGGTWVYLEPSELYVNKPVPAADGKPLREGETVFNERGDRFTVSKVDHKHGVFSATSAFDGREGMGFCPIYFTHERPDSWERLEEDAGKNPFDYCKNVGHRLDTCENSEAYKARDLVRRAKALAGDV